MNTASTAPRFSTRIAQLEASPIREILSVIDRPGMISFAGGLPAPETFPAMNLANVPAKWLQYGPSEGDPELRQCIAEDLNRLGLKCTAGQVLILSGSQQGIDLVGKLFIDAGTPVAVESPTYLAALQVFRYFGARFCNLDPRLPGAGFAGDERPAFAYAIPTFQNPTGHCYDAAERQTLARACDEFDVPLFEDDPYRDLVYDECQRTPVCASLRRASWIYQGSFSKSLAPGLRLGYLVASPDLVMPLLRLKQAADLHSNRISQWYVLGQLQDAGRAQRLAGIVDIYRRKRDLFARQLEQHFSDLANWRVPAGGLFFWLQLKIRIDTRCLLPQAIQHNVAFMPGEPFFADTQAAGGALRLNFSHADNEQIARGLATLARLIRQASVTA
ncbi:MAG: PLP-dependent aminotransferase family protein [Bacteroidota bacterium]